MTILIISLVLSSWFLIGLVAGLICSWIDVKYNGFRYEWIDPLKMSFLGVLLLIWSLFFYFRSKKKDKKSY